MMQTVIRPISHEEWLPDRCLTSFHPFRPFDHAQQSGCASLSSSYTSGDRHRLDELYRRVLDRFGCCGFIAWWDDTVLGYNTFFPEEIAVRTRFYGWGFSTDPSPTTLVHHCISLTRDPAYRRQGIGSSLISRSLEWAMSAGWSRFEVHHVPPDSPAAFTSDQKSCCSFWTKLGFQVAHSYDAPEAARLLYGTKMLHTFAIDL